MSMIQPLMKVNVPSKMTSGGDSTFRADPRSNIQITVLGVKHAVLALARVFRCRVPRQAACGCGKNGRIRKVAHQIRVKSQMSLLNGSTPTLPCGRHAGWSTERYVGEALLAGTSWRSFGRRFLRGSI